MTIEEAQPSIKELERIAQGRAEDWMRLKALEDCCFGLVNQSRWPYPDGSPTEKVPKAFMDYLRAIIKRMEKELPQ